MSEFFDTLASMQTLIAAFVGGVAGFIASLAGPWVQWIIERRRTRQAARAELLQEGRRLAAGMPSVVNTFRKENAIIRLEPYLSDEFKARYITIKKAADGSTPTVAVTGVGGGRDATPMGTALLREIARLEREWRLL